MEKLHNSNNIRKKDRRHCALWTQENLVKMVCFHKAMASIKSLAVQNQQCTIGVLRATTNCVKLYIYIQERLKHVYLLYLYSTEMSITTSSSQKVKRFCCGLHIYFEPILYSYPTNWAVFNNRFGISNYPTIASYLGDSTHFT